MPALIARVRVKLLFLLVGKLVTANLLPTKCKCSELIIRNDLNCVCKDRVLMVTYFYPLTKIPPNNLTAPVELLLGPPNNQRGFSELIECARSPLFRLDAMPRPTNATQAKLVAFNNFDFSDRRAKRIGPWLGNLRSSIEAVQILCGTMTTLVTLPSGMFHGFTQLNLVVIAQTGLLHIDHGAFAVLSSEQPIKLTELYIVGNPLQSFDWSVLEPTAASLESVRLTNNNVSEMHTSFPVSYPALYGISLESNKLRSVSADVIAAWTAGSMGITLGDNPLCPMDNLCRCCSLRPLFQFAHRTDTVVDLNCGPTETSYCDATTVRRTPQCTTQCYTSGNVTGIAQLTDYDNCSDSDIRTMSCELG